MVAVCGVFFDPLAQRPARDAKDPFDPAHARSFLIGAENLFTVFRGIPLMRLQYPGGAAIFTEILLIAAPISTIFDNIEAAALAALVLNGCGDHVPDPIS